METSSPTKSTPELTPKRPKTGLSQSDQSLSDRLSYGYTSQTDYGGGPRGYPEETKDETTPRRVPAITTTKPKITSALYKKTIDFDPLFSDVFTNGVDDEQVTIAARKTIDGGLESDAVNACWKKGAKEEE